MRLLARAVVCASLAVALSSEAHAQIDHLVISEVASDTAHDSSAGMRTDEYIEIFNPTNSTIDLADVFISDDPEEYYRVPHFAGPPRTPVTGINFSDWIWQFPASATLTAGAVAVVCDDDVRFLDSYFGGHEAQHLQAFRNTGAQLFECSDDNDTVSDMIPWHQLPQYPTASRMSLTNYCETVILFSWDGASDLIKDLDTVCWIHPSSSYDARYLYLFNKSGVSVDGPDADVQTTQFQADLLTVNSVGRTGYTPQTLRVVENPRHPKSAHRVKNTETAELLSGGNGTVGHDESTEDWYDTFSLDAYSPGLPSPGLANTPPTVNITAPPDGSTYDQGNSITFAGSATEDVGGTGADLSADLVWTSSIDGAFGPGGATFDYSLLSVGGHTITATATNSSSLEGSDSISVTMNGAPTVTIGQPQNGETLIQAVAYTFAATATDDLDGDLTDSVVWSSSKDGVFQLDQGKFSGLSEGTHTVHARATDTRGLQGTDSVTVHVVNTPPWIVAITSPDDGSTHNQNQSITFTATASDTEEGDLSDKIHWSSDKDGTIGTGATVTSNALSEATHVITATVKDAPGLEDSQAVTVTVENPAPVISTITLARNRIEYVRGEEIVLSTTASDPNGGPTGGPIDVTSAIVWTSSEDGKLGTGGLLATTPLSVNVHTITATATDRNGKPADPQQITVAVLRPLSGAPPTVEENAVAALLGVYEAPNGVRYTLTHDGHLLKIEIFRPTTGETTVRGAVWVATDPPKAVFVRPRPDPTDANLGIVTVVLDKDETTGGLWQRVYPQGIAGDRPTQPARTVLLKLIGK
ncbi:Ig-like domain-containing protein [Planctomycetota bacterium]